MQHWQVIPSFTKWFRIYCDSHSPFQQASSSVTANISDAQIDSILSKVKNEFASQVSLSCYWFHALASTLTPLTLDT